MSGIDILVVGSINQDIVVRVDRLPGPGETLLGQEQKPTPGGKGANQAVAAARLGAAVAMVGAVGDDAAGRTLRRNLSEAGVDVRAVQVRNEAPTGTAFILSDADGENVIVVSAGANGLLDADLEDGLSASLIDAAVTLIQLEIPLDCPCKCTSVAGLSCFEPGPGHPRRGRSA